MHSRFLRQITEETHVGCTSPLGQTLSHRRLPSSARAAALSVPSVTPMRGRGYGRNTNARTSAPRISERVCSLCSLGWPLGSAVTPRDMRLASITDRQFDTWLIYRRGTKYLLACFKALRRFVGENNGAAWGIHCLATV